MPFELLVAQSTKDVWEKIDAVSGLVSGVLVALVGAVATYLFNERAHRQQQAATGQSERQRATQHAQDLRVAQVQALAAFLPYLGAVEAREREAALVAISALELEDPTLAVRLAAMYRSDGGEEALARIAQSPNREASDAAVDSLTGLFGVLESAIVRVAGADSSFRGCGFAIREGLICTANFVLSSKPTDAPGTLSVTSVSGSSAEAMVVWRSTDFDGVALLSTPLDLGTKLDLVGDLHRITPGTRVTIMGRDQAARGWRTTTGTIVGLHTMEDRGIVTAGSGPMLTVAGSRAGKGYAGAPAVDDRGRVLGMVTLRDETGDVFLTSGPTLLAALRELDGETP